jgi:hypothetical protein
MHGRNKLVPEVRKRISPGLVIKKGKKTTHVFATHLKLLLLGHLGGDTHLIYIRGNNETPAFLPESKFSTVSDGPVSKVYVNTVHSQLFGLGINRPRS